MAKNITVKVAGGQEQVIEADTVAQAAEIAGATNHSACINGEPAEFSDTLEDYNWVTFAPKVKAG